MNMKKLLLTSTCLAMVLIVQSQNDWDTLTAGQITYTNGKVGIGTTNPKGVLHVNSGAIPESSVNQFDANLLIQADGQRELDKGAVLGFAIPSADNGNSWQQGRIIVIPDNNSENNAHGKMYLQTRFWTGSSWDWKSNLVLKPSGNVGIGTTSPSHRLQVENGHLSVESSSSYGLGLYRKTTAANTGQALYWYTNNSAGTKTQNGFFLGKMTDATSGSEDGYIETAVMLNGSLSRNVMNFYGDKVIIKNGVNLGIGTTIPSEKLEVNGTIRSKEVKVEASPWPDYVFTDNYQLTTLKELEAFIKSHKHLPEIPSASQIEANGLQLGEMNALLLKKIEELTLYTIQQSKEIEQQESKNKELEKKLAANNLQLGALIQRIEKLEMNQK